jgi:hypothetical protein
MRQAMQDPTTKRRIYDNVNTGLTAQNARFNGLLGLFGDVTLNMPNCGPRAPFCALPCHEIGVIAPPNRGGLRRTRLASDGSSG